VGEGDGGLDRPRPRHLGERALHVRGRVEVRGRRVGARAGRDPVEAVDAERAQRVAVVVVRDEVPPPGVDDEPERAQLAPRRRPVVRDVRARHPAPRPDRAREREDGRGGRRRRAGGDGRGGERDDLLEGLDPRAQAVGQDPPQLGQRAAGRVAGRVEAEAPGGDEREHGPGRLVVVEHERRHPVPRAQSVAAAEPALALDRDAERLERGDVAPDRPRVHLEAGGELRAGDQRAVLEDLEAGEHPGGGGRHDRCRVHREQRTEAALNSRTVAA
jgi:hypothetical protein